MEEEVKKLREAGFSDEDIRAYMEEQKSSSSSTAPAPVSPDQVANEPNRVDETVPDYGGTPETSWKETAGTFGTAVAPYAAPVAIGGAGLYGASVAKKGFEAMKSASQARTAQANAQMATAQGLQQRAEQREAARLAKAAPGPVAPQILDSRGQPMRAPAPAPAVAPAPAPAPQISNAKNIVQKLALDKLLPAVGNFANKALPAAQVAAGLFYTSPEEIAILKAAEEKKKQAQGIRR